METLAPSALEKIVEYSETQKGFLNKFIQNVSEDLPPGFPITKALLDTLRSILSNITTLNTSPGEISKLKGDAKSQISPSLTTTPEIEGLKRQVDELSKKLSQPSQASGEHEKSTEQLELKSKIKELEEKIKNEDEKLKDDIQEIIKQRDQFKKLKSHTSNSFTFGNDIHVKELFQLIDNLKKDNTKPSQRFNTVVDDLKKYINEYKSLCDSYQVKLGTVNGSIRQRRGGAETPEKRNELLTIASEAQAKVTSYISNFGTTIYPKISKYIAESNPQTVWDFYRNYFLACLIIGKGGDATRSGLLSRGMHAALEDIGSVPVE